MIDRIQAKDIRKQYNSKFLLNCSLDIKRDSLYAIIGPNGSGKSTLLRILSLIEPPDSGEVTYFTNGRALSNSGNDIDLRRKGVLVPTRAALFNDSVFENVAYGLRLRRMDRREERDRVMGALEHVNLDDKKERNACGLSSGEAQRLALARAIAIAPDILYLDEPTASLDVENTYIIEDIIRLQKKQEKIIVLVTHNLNQAKGLSDIVIFMYDGRVIETEDAGIFFHSPVNEVARKFVSGEIY